MSIVKDTNGKHNRYMPCDDPVMRQTFISSSEVPSVTSLLNFSENGEL